MAFPKLLRSLRLFRLIPAALISVIVMALMSLLGLLNFGSGVPSDPATTPVQTAEANEPSGKDEPSGKIVLDESDRPAANERQGSPMPPDASMTAESPADLNPARLLDVLIDGETFLVRVDAPVDAGPTRQPRRLDEIESLAGDVPGDDAGIRARVTRRFNAVARAERALLETLSNAGLTDDEIDYRRTLVD